MAEVGGQSLRVDAGRDQDRRERVASLVQADRFEPGLLPRLLRAGDASRSNVRDPLPKKSSPLGRA